MSKEDSIIQAFKRKQAQLEKRHGDLLEKLRDVQDELDLTNFLRDAGLHSANCSIYREYTTIRIDTSEIDVLIQKLSVRLEMEA
jgi:hypothetical protein